jgi:hypothetical protein
MNPITNPPVLRGALFFKIIAASTAGTGGFYLMSIYERWLRSPISQGTRQPGMARLRSLEGLVLVSYEGGFQGNLGISSDWDRLDASQINAWSIHLWEIHSGKRIEDETLIRARPYGTSEQGPKSRHQTRHPLFYCNYMSLEGLPKSQE